jgi:hypothetical protein
VEGELPRHLERGLVEAGEGAAGAGRLELRVQVRVATVGLAEEALLLAEADGGERAVLDAERRLAGADRARRGEVEELVVEGGGELASAGGGAGDERAVELGGDRRAHDGERLAVQPQLGYRAGDAATVLQVIQAWTILAGTTLV